MSQLSLVADGLGHLSKGQVWVNDALGEHDRLRRVRIVAPNFLGQVGVQNATWGGETTWMLRERFVEQYRRED